MLFIWYLRLRYKGLQRVIVIVLYSHWFIYFLTPSFFQTFRFASLDFIPSFLFHVLIWCFFPVKNIIKTISVTLIFSFFILFLNLQLGSGGEEYEDEHTECMLTFIAQLDPKGWIWRAFGYQQESLQKVWNASINILNFFIWSLQCIGNDILENRTLISRISLFEFLLQLMMHVLDIKDSLDIERFAQVK